MSALLQSARSYSTRCPASASTPQALNDQVDSFLSRFKALLATSQRPALFTSPHPEEALCSLMDGLVITVLSRAAAALNTNEFAQQCLSLQWADKKISEADAREVAACCWSRVRVPFVAPAVILASEPAVTKEREVEIKPLSDGERDAAWYLVRERASFNRREVQHLPLLVAVMGCVLRNAPTSDAISALTSELAEEGVTLAKADRRVLSSHSRYPATVRTLSHHLAGQQHVQEIGSLILGVPWRVRATRACPYAPSLEEVCNHAAHCLNESYEQGVRVLQTVGIAAVIPLQDPSQDKVPKMKERLVPLHPPSLACIEQGIFHVRAGQVPSFLRSKGMLRSEATVVDHTARVVSTDFGDPLFSDQAVVRSRLRNFLVNGQRLAPGAVFDRGPAGVANGLRNRLLGPGLKQKIWDTEPAVKMFGFAAYQATAYTHILTTIQPKFELYAQSLTVDDCMPKTWSQKRRRRVREALLRLAAQDRVTFNSVARIKGETIKFAGEDTKARFFVSPDEMVTLAWCKLMKCLELAFRDCYGAHNIKSRAKARLMKSLSRLFHEHAHNHIGHVRLTEHDYSNFDTTEACSVKAEWHFLLKPLLNRLLDLDQELSVLLSPSVLTALFAMRESPYNYWDMSAYDTGQCRQVIITLVLVKCRESGDRGTSILNQIVNWVWDSWLQTGEFWAASFLFTFTMVSMRENTRVLLFRVPWLYEHRTRTPTEDAAEINACARADLVFSVFRTVGVPPDPEPPWRLFFHYRCKEGDDDVAIEALSDAADGPLLDATLKARAASIGAVLKVDSRATNDWMQATFCGEDMFIHVPRGYAVPCPPISYPTVIRNIRAASLKDDLHQPRWVLDLEIALSLGHRAVRYAHFPVLGAQYMQASAAHFEQARCWYDVLFPRRTTLDCMSRDTQWLLLHEHYTPGVEDAVTVDSAMAVIVAAWDRETSLPGPRVTFADHRARTGEDIAVEP